MNAHETARARFVGSSQAHDFDAASVWTLDWWRIAEVAISACVVSLARRPAHRALQVKYVPAAERDPLLLPKAAALTAVAPLVVRAAGKRRIATLWLFHTDAAPVRLIVGRWSAGAAGTV